MVNPLVMGARAVRYTAAALALTAPYVRARRNGDVRGLAVALVRHARRLGPGAVKLVQLASTRRDLIPSRACDVLTELVDDGASTRYQGRDATTFVTDAVLPAGVNLTDDQAKHGSVASVVFGTADGERLAAKVLRRYDVATLRADLALLRAMSTVLNLIRPGIGRSMMQILDAMALQADLVREARMLAWLATAVGDRRNIVVPKVVDALSSDAVMWMSRVPDRSTRPWGREDAERAIRLVFELIFIHGLAHCDLHGGNLYVTDDGDLVILDAGFVVQLDSLTQSQFAEFFIAIATDDADTCVGVILETADTDEVKRADVGALRHDMAELLRTATGRRANAFSLARFALELMSLQMRQGIVPAPQFSFPLTSLMTLEGRIKASHPTMDFQAIATSVILRAALVEGKVRKMADRPYSQPK